MHSTLEVLFWLTFKKDELKADFSKFSNKHTYVSLQHIWDFKFLKAETSEQNDIAML